MLNLSKNSPSINLSKAAKHTLSALTVGLSWDGDSDLDASAIVKKDGVLLGGSLETSLVGFPMLDRNSDGSYKQQADGTPVYLWNIKGIEYSGDARDGSAQGYDETLKFNLNKVEGDEILIFLTSYSSEAAVSFGSAENPKSTLCDQDDKPLVEIPLDIDAAFGTAFHMVRIFKENNEWKFENVSELVGTSANGLQDVINKLS